jgi:hypothetical protein
VLALVDGKILGNPARERRIVVIPAGRKFFEANRVRPVAVDLVVLICTNAASAA